MAYVCMRCYEVYSSEITHLRDKKFHGHLSCPKYDCAGEVVEIDDIILPTIILLNQKGYKTRFCCGGHAMTTCIDMYISFNFGSSYKNYIPLPEGFIVDERDSLCYTIRHTIDTGSDPIPDLNVMHADVLKHAAILHEWAKKLQPSRYIEALR